MIPSKRFLTTAVAIALASSLAYVQPAAAQGVEPSSSDSTEAAEVEMVLDTVDQAIVDAGVSPVAGTSDEVAAAATPTDLDDGIELASGMEIFVDAEVEADRIISDGVAVYGGSDMNVAVEIGPDEARIMVVIEAADAPNEYRFDLALQPGESLSLPNSEFGEARVLNEMGETMSSFSPAWAVDADGNDVPTWYEVDGATLVQVVDHAGAAYPVTADPTNSCGWVTCTLYFNKAETKTIANGGWGVATLTGLCTAAGGPLAGAACLVGAGSIAYTASVATNSRKCLKLKYVPVPVAPTIWPGSYTGGNCK